MKDLQSLIQHPSCRAGLGLVLEGGKPIGLLLEQGTKALGQPLSHQQILGLLKGSLPAETMSEFGWGKSLDLNLQVAGKDYPMRVELGADRSVSCKIDLRVDGAPAAKQESAPAPKPSPSPSFTRGDVRSVPEVPEDVLREETARLTDDDHAVLVYHDEDGDPGPIRAKLEEMGYPVRVCSQPAAALEVLRYHNYPMAFLVLGADFHGDPVYAGFTWMTMAMRRRCFSVLVAPGLPDDGLTAFSLSVHMTVNSDSMNGFDQALAKGLKDWQRFMSGFFSALDAMGKN